MNPDTSAIWAEFESSASAAMDESATVDNTAADANQPDPADAHTADDAATDAAEDVKEAEAESSEKSTDTADEAASGDETSELDEKDDTESFDELLDPIPTAEQLLAKHTRIPDETKQELVSLADNWRSAQEKLNRIGGELGVEMLEPVVNLLGNPDPTPHDAITAFDQMLKTNQTATLLGILESSEAILTSPHEHFQKMSDALIARVFGDNVTKEHIQQLLLLEQAGITNLEEDLKYVEANTEGATSVFTKQNETIKQLQKQLAEKEELLNDPEKLAKVQTSKSDTAFETDFDGRIKEAIDPFLKKGNWSQESALVKHVMPSIMNSLKNDPDYQQMKAYIRQNGYNAKNLPFPVASKLLALTNKAKARTEIAIREINAELRGRAANGLNATVKQKTATTKPQAVAVAKKTDNGTLARGTAAFEKEREAIWREFEEQEAAAGYRN